MWKRKRHTSSEDHVTVAASLPLLLRLPPHPGDNGRVRAPFKSRAHPAPVGGPKISVAAPENPKQNSTQSRGNVRQLCF